MSRYDTHVEGLAQLAAAPAVQAAMAAAAREISRQAAQLAPVGDTGRYKRSLKAKGPVAYSDDPFAHLVEFGSVNNPAYAPLRRAVRASGLRLDQAPI
jgi:hypothetical protein